MKLLLLAEGYPPELLEGFEVVREPQDDVVAALTMLEPRVGEELYAQLPALRVVEQRPSASTRSTSRPPRRAASPS